MIPAKRVPFSMIASCSLDKSTEVEPKTTPRVILDPQTPEKLDEFADEYCFNINPKLADKERQEILQLLYDNRSVFAKSPLDLKRYPYYSHDIEVSSYKRILKRNYKFSDEDAEIINRQISDMLKWAWSRGARLIVTILHVFSGQERRRETIRDRPSRTKFNDKTCYGSITAVY